MIRSTLVWHVDPVEHFADVERKIRNKALRIALNAGASPVKEAVTQAAPKDRGHLSKATKIKVKNYRRGDVWVAIVGAGSKFKRVKRLKNGQTRNVYPYKYQHFVDRGTSHSRARHYLDRAWAAAQAQFEARARQKLKQVLPELLKK